MSSKANCPLSALSMVNEDVRSIRAGEKQRINAIWFEATGCSGNIISLLNATDPDVVFFLREMVNLTYNNSIMAGERAKYVLAVGTCASSGGPSAARPNPSESVSIGTVLQREVINLPGCPCNPRWVIRTVAHIITKGKPELDDRNRPILFYGVTIHDRCPRRSFFDNGIFARKPSRVQ